MQIGDWVKHKEQDCIGQIVDEYVEWNALNGMCVPRSIFTDKALDYLLNKDGRFVKVDSK